MYHNGDIALHRHHYWQAMKYVGGSAALEACSCSDNQDISRLYRTRRNMFTRIFLLSLSQDRWIHYIFPFLPDILSSRVCTGLPAGVQLRFSQSFWQKKSSTSISGLSVFRLFHCHTVDRTKRFPLCDDNTQNIETGCEFIGWFHLAQNWVFSSKKTVLLVLVR